VAVAESVHVETGMPPVRVRTGHLVVQGIADSRQTSQKVTFLLALSLTAGSAGLQRRAKLLWIIQRCR
jgi:hypothetical protein